MKLIKLIAFILLPIGLFAQKDYSLTAPSGKLKVEISVDKTIEYQITHAGDLMLGKSPISMTLSDGTQWGVDPRLTSVAKNSVDEQIKTQIYKRNIVNNCYNELILKFKGNYNIIFRAYDDGIAYRFVSTQKKPFRVKSEQAEFNFPDNPKIYVPYVCQNTQSLTAQFFNSFENTYAYLKLSDWDKSRLAFTPLLVERPNGKKVCLAEADLLDYPGMYLYNGDGNTALKGVFATYPKDMEQGGHNNLQMLVKSREDYIAKFEKGIAFPWRAVIVVENDAELADNDMVYKLAAPAEGDYSWVKPGKVAWDWWNDWNLYNVDFKTGINNETYKYYIDFASKYGIEYVILDEGWAVNKKADLFQVIPEIDLPGLVAYAEKKNVGLILWAGYWAFDRDLEAVCKHYSEMGIKGFKVDFMDRDDQIMVDFHHRGAEIGAKYKMLIDYHGTYKPTGLQRTYPNVINFEGVHGLEQMKWVGADIDQVTYDVMIPFIRQVAGPIDYTQGAMRNAAKGNYRPVYNEAMSQGTRCRQLAQYIIFESPLNMLCDSPSNYESEEECTRFIADVPTVWDESRSLNGKVGEYITIARKSGSDWYVGSLTNWDARELEIDLSFLGEGNFKAEVFKDGINAGKAAKDYKKETIDIPADKKLKIVMVSGGGYVMKIYKI
ncbi:MAG: glycoside hydrolase family 97 protein [Monoglobales bacterium]